MELHLLLQPKVSFDWVLYNNYRVSKLLRVKIIDQNGKGPDFWLIRCQEGFYPKHIFNSGTFWSCIFMTPRIVPNLNVSIKTGDGNGSMWKNHWLKGFDSHKVVFHTDQYRSKSLKCCGITLWHLHVSGCDIRCHVTHSTQSVNPINILVAVLLTSKFGNNAFELECKNHYQNEWDALKTWHFCLFS